MPGYYQRSSVPVCIPDGDNVGIKEGGKFDTEMSENF